MPPSSNLRQRHPHPTEKVEASSRARGVEALGLVLVSLLLEVVEEVGVER